MIIGFILILSSSHTGHEKNNQRCLDQVKRQSIKLWRMQQRRHAGYEISCFKLHCSLSRVTIVFCYNISAMYFFSNPVQHQHTKHIKIDIHFVWEKVAKRKNTGSSTSLFKSITEHLCKGSLFFTGAITRPTLRSQESNRI